MSLSRESVQDGKPNVIKLHSRFHDLKIVDYRSVIEEIVADKKNIVKVDVEDIVGSAQPMIGEPVAIDVDAGLQEAAKKAVAEAYEKGFEAGKLEASITLQSEYDRKVGEVTENFPSVLREFAAEVARFSQDFDRAVVTLALAIARRIVAREIAEDEGAVLAKSREAIKKIIGVEKIKIHINPSDEEYMREHRNDLSAYADSVKEIVIEADGKVERGGCIIESELGNIDARVSTQFELIEEALLGLTK